MKRKDREKRVRAIIRENGGIAASSRLMAGGLSKTDIYLLKKAGDITCIRRGYFSCGEGEASEEELISRFLPDAIVYGNSALFYYGYSDYTPREWMLAVPRDISRSRLIGTGIPMKLHYDSYYGLGMADGDFNGIKLLVYDRERTICDCIRHRNSMDGEIFVKAVNAYAMDKNKDLQKLSDYARKLRISGKVREIMEIVLNA